jgi:molecular chaperone DnaK
MDLAGDNSVKAVVSVSNNAKVEGGVDLGLDDFDDDFESVD